MSITEKFTKYINSINNLGKAFPDCRGVNLNCLERLPLYAKQNILLYHGVK